MPNKKAQGLSLNVIIIAAVVLIVLIVLWSIFTGRMGVFTKGVVECRIGCKKLSECQAIAPEGHKDCLDSKYVGDRKWSSNEDVVCCLLKE